MNFREMAESVSCLPNLVCEILISARPPNAFSIDEDAVLTFATKMNFLDRLSSMCVASVSGGCAGFRPRCHMLGDAREQPLIGFVVGPADPRSLRGGFGLRPTAFVRQKPGQRVIGAKIVGLQHRRHG